MTSVEVVKELLAPLIPNPRALDRRAHQILAALGIDPLAPTPVTDMSTFGKTRILVDGKELPTREFDLSDIGPLPDDARLVTDTEHLARFVVEFRPPRRGEEYVFFDKILTCDRDDYPDTRAVIVDDDA